MEQLPKIIFVTGETTIKTLLIFLFLSSTAAYAKNFQFFCNSNGWYPFTGKDYYHALVKSSDCMNVEGRLALTARLKAKSLCRQWAKNFAIDDKDITFFFKEQAQCQSENQKVDRELEQRRINRIYAYSQKNGLAKTSYYINNTEIEKPIYLTDGSEQAQWLQVGDRRFCGLINSDVAFLETPQSMVVRILSIGQEFTYFRIAKNADEEIFRASSRKFQNAQYLGRAKGFTFFNIGRDGNRQSLPSSNLSYLDQARGQRYCRPLTW